MPQKPDNTPAESRPPLADVIEHNIHTLYDLHQNAIRTRSVQDRLADMITDVSGRMAFVYLHIVWFGLWFLLNTGRLGLRPFDPFPYGLLTMVVSLEAIFLATFVLISQNRLSADATRRADLALQIGLLTEHELTHILRMLDGIQKHLGIANDADSELVQLELETRPEDVLAEIVRVQQQVHRTRQAAQT